MAEFASNPLQIIDPGQNVILDTVIPCNKGYVYHRNQSGIVILRGIVNNPTSCFARYQVTFNGNIALAEGATVGPISVALAIDGEPIQTSKAIVTPAAASEAPPSVANYFNVTSTAIITVPKGCCFSVAVENTSGPAAAGGVAPQINVLNANLTVARIA
jgi:hypothetical protein